MFLGEQVKRLFTKQHYVRANQVASLLKEQWLMRTAGA